MPPLPVSKGLVVTNPLVLYRRLVGQGKIGPDPSQHRFAIYLEKLYDRLKDYKPGVDFKHRLRNLDHQVRQSKSSDQLRDGTQRSGNETSNGAFARWKQGKQEKQITALTRKLTDHESVLQLDSPRGLLVHGEVGTGKSMLVDLFAHSLPNERKRRWHFNTFMLATYAKLEEYRRTSAQSVQVAAHDSDEYSMLCLAREMILASPILFLDEFQLPDRAASKILSNLLTSFFQLGGVLVATSNRMPEELAKAAGVEYAPPPLTRRRSFTSRLSTLQNHSFQGKSETMFAGKSDFFAFLEVLKARCDVWDMDGGRDWRRHPTSKSSTSQQRSKTDRLIDVRESPERAASGSESRAGDHEISSSSTLNNGDVEEPGADRPVAPPPYFIVLPHDPPVIVNTQETVQRREAEAMGIVLGSPPKWEQRAFTVYGREFLVPKANGQTCKWDFQELCGTALGAADYTTLASNFHTVIVWNIPMLDFAKRNEARRFITLIDCLYEAGCRLLISAVSEPDDLFFSRENTFRKVDSPSVVQDEVYSETLSEIYQDQTSPFRPNIASYSPSASTPSYASSDLLTSASQLSKSRSILADEDSDFGPVHGASRHQGQSVSVSIPATGTVDGGIIPNFSNTTPFTGEDERFAYKRAVSRLWEMCSARWWSREGDWWKPLSLDDRQWERPKPPVIPSGEQRVLSEINESLGSSTSPFRTAVEPPPRIGWVHAWGMMRWGKKAGAWGQGPEGLPHRSKGS